MKFDNLDTECKHIDVVKKVQKENEETIDKMANILKILGEPSRMKIVLALRYGELCVYHIVSAVNLTQSSVSHQLRILKDNNIVKSRKDGQNVIYYLYDDHIMQIIDLVKSHVEE